MNRAQAICQEFCDEVSVSSHTGPLGVNDFSLDFNVTEELKCRLHIDYFTPLVERMIQVGYCCTQVQKDLKGQSCTAWFEPQTG